ncbi:Zn(II)2Cys6 transcription factor domain-containing protein [Aspergillus mulundensis]|uniref:Zn(2)-C6 fungal-type domain-containing protein n=1 Tax=Aspergillus mulundensis TaxID=1810919 RepID=A0A3D8QJ29_9EURO|nr:hypothetical protein DSM5745_10390 [Aspergillus mulundensis]RDW61718.1 hypothetical protein DSM5745_10390 [Aspergillus mulundensis]
MLIPDLTLSSHITSKMEPQSYNGSTPWNSDFIPGPAPQQSSVNAESEFRCGICNKTYSRRDLRDRHRRRCIKTIGKERPSKRKSCETCARKKLRCSMARPACSRCLQIGIQCLYPRSVIPVQHQRQDRHESSPGESWMSSTLEASFGGAGTIQPFLIQDLESGGLSQMNRNGSGFRGAGALVPEFADPVVGAGVFTNIDMFQDPALLAPISWNEEFSLSSQSLGQDEEILDSISRNHSTSGSFQCHFDAQAAGGGAAQSVLRLFDHPNPNSHPAATMSSLSSNTGSSLPDTSASGSDSSATSIRAPSTPFNPSASTQLIFAHDFHPKPPYNPSTLYQDVLSTLRSYPSLILQRDHWSPFVHHQLYRCSTGGMAKPMGVALACVSAHAGSYGSSHGFVDKLINSERAQLVRNFPTYLDTPENCIATVHAVCIYQVLGLLGHEFSPAAVKQSQEMQGEMEKGREECEREAEMHSSFLLKMARRLYNHHRTAILTPHSTELNWERWKFAESLRRNIFFANIINIVGSRAGKLNGAYFEPLDDEMVLNLPLPAPECMWRACSLREWLGAREYALRFRQSEAESRMDSGPEGEGGNTRLTQTLKGLIEAEEEGRLDVKALLPLTRVILASVKIAPAGGCL